MCTTLADGSGVQMGSHVVELVLHEGETLVAVDRWCPRDAVRG